jgi:hypothetical protein
VSGACVLPPDSAAIGLGDAEVDHLQASVATEHHVRRLQVAMHDAHRVRGGQRFRQGNGDAEQFSSARPPGRMRSSSVPPSTSSMVMNARPSDSSTECTVITLG